LVLITACRAGSTAGPEFSRALRGARGTPESPRVPAPLGGRASLTRSGSLLPSRAVAAACLTARYDERHPVMTHAPSLSEDRPDTTPETEPDSGTDRIRPSRNQLYKTLWRWHFYA